MKKIIAFLFTLKNKLLIFDNSVWYLALASKSFITRVIFSLEFLSKKIFWLVSFLVILFTSFSFVIDTFKKSVYINAVSVPVEIIDSGRSSDVITENLLININKILSSEDTHDEDYLHTIIKKYKLGEEECVTNLSKDPQIATIAKHINLEVSRKSDNFTITTSEAVISISNLSSRLRNLFGKTTIELKPSILKLGTSDKFLVRVTAIYNTQITHKTEWEAKSIVEAEDFLTLLILKYSNPAMYASAIFIYKPSEAEDALKLAIKHIDGYRKISSPYTMLGFLFSGSNKQAEIYSNTVISKKYFEKALAIDPNDYYAVYGMINVNRILNQSNLQKYYKKNLHKEIKIAYTLINNNHFLAESYSHLYEIYNYVGDKIKARKTIINALDKHPNNIDIKALYINSLIDNKKYEEAEKFLNKVISLPELDTRDPYNELIETRLTSTPKALIIAKLKLMAITGDYKEIPIYSEALDKCYRISWLSYLAHSIYSKEQNNQNKLEIQQLVDAEFLASERYGVVGYSFYETWGDFLSRSGRNLDAISKYKIALEYPGEHRWTLLNISARLNELKEYKEAEIYARKSLAVGVISNGIAQLLTSIYYQGNFKRFLNEYSAWKVKLSSHLNLEFEILAAYAECNLGNEQNVKRYLESIQLKKELINPNDKSNIENLKKLCVF